MDAEVKRAFILRPHIVDGAEGFVRMDVLSPEDMPNEIWLMTYWADIASYRTWHKSHAYHESHAGIPKGVEACAGQRRLTYIQSHCLLGNPDLLKEGAQA